MRSTITTVALVTIAAMLSGCCCPSEEELEAARQKREAEREENVKKVQKYQKKLAKISKGVPAASALKQKACPDDDIAKVIKKTKGFTGRLKRIDAAKLDWISQKDPAGNRAKVDKWNYLNEGFSKFNSLDNLDDAYRAEEAAKAVDKLKKEPYFAVIVREDGALPVVNDDDSFTGGFIEAWIVVMDTKKAAPVCQTRFVAENSEVVEYREGKIVSDEYKFKEAVKDDFEDNTDKAAKASMKKITKKLKVTWGLF